MKIISKFVCLSERLFLHEPDNNVQLAILAQSQLPLCRRSTENHLGSINRRITRQYH